MIAALAALLAASRIVTLDEAVQSAREHQPHAPRIGESRFASAGRDAQASRVTRGSESHRD